MREEEVLYSAPIEEAAGSEETLQALIEMAKTDTEAAEELADLYAKGEEFLQDYEAALYWYGKSRSSTARYRAASIYLKLEQYEKAEQEFLKGLEAEDSEAEVYLLLNLGMMYITKNTLPDNPHYDKTITCLERALSLDPTLGRVCAGALGKAYEGSGRKLQAIHWYKEAAETFGQIEYKKYLHRLYLTGVAGKAKKLEAEAVEAMEQKE